MIDTDSLFDSIGYRTESNEEVFRKLFYTIDPSHYGRFCAKGTRKDPTQIYKHISPTFKNGFLLGEYDDVFKLAEKDTFKRQISKNKISSNYRGPYQYHVFRGTRILPKNTRMVYLDVDDPKIVPTLMKTPLQENAIWSRSKTEGHFHIYILCQEINSLEARKLLTNWLSNLGICFRCSQGKPQIESNILDLQTIVLPGQEPNSYIVEPGQWNKVLINTYKDSRLHFIEWYRNKKFDLNELFSIESKPACYKPSCNEYEFEETQSTNRIKSEQLADIPGLGHSMGCTIFGNRYDFNSQSECIEMPNGFAVSCAYIGALTRKHKANYDAIFKEAFWNRQSLRPGWSKKHKYGLRLRHVRNMVEHFCTTYNPNKNKKDFAQLIEDTKAQEYLNTRKKSSVAKVIQNYIKQYKVRIIKRNGSCFYRECQRVSVLMLRDIYKNNGRIARRSNKLKSEYAFSDSNCLYDYGKKRVIDKVIRFLKSLGIFTNVDSKGNRTFNRQIHKCCRWTVGTHLLERAEEYVRTEEEERQHKAYMLLKSSPTNIQVHHQQLVDEEFIPWNCIMHKDAGKGEYSVSFEEKLVEVRELLRDTCS